jgi:DNA polymerase elongation subunit (family B)
MAEAITSTGQVFIKHTMCITNEIIQKILGNKIECGLMADTDSFYFSVDDIVKKHCKGKTDHQIVDFLEKFVVDILQPELNKQLSQIAKTMGIDDCKIFYKLECIGPSMIMVAKKKYMFDILYAEGVRYSEPKMKVMGIEIVRSSTPSVVKDYLKKAAKICLSKNEEELQEYVTKVKEDFMKQSYHAICFPRGVNGMKTYSSSSSIYMKGCPIHVRAALLYNHHLKQRGLDSKYPLIADGDKIKFVYLKKPNHIYEDVIAFPTKLPEELDLIKYIDKEMQFEKTFLKPLESISSTIGWHTKEQPSLDSLFD